MKLPRLERRTLPAVLAAAAEDHPSAPYVYFEDDVYTYEDAELFSNRLANGLAALGVGRGSHVALVLDNCPDYLWAVFALAKLGAVAVPVNTAAKGELLAYYLRDADCDFAIAEPHYEAAIAAAAAARPLQWILGRDELELLAREHGDGRPPVEVGFSEPWFILYTSGTTGPSKGVVCPHAHPLTVGYRVSGRFGFDSSDRLYTCLPLFHGNALWYSSLSALAAGASIALARRFSAGSFWSDIHRYQATEFNAIMSVAAILEKREPAPEELDNPVRIAFIVPLPRERRALEERWGLKMVCNYAMSELFPVAVLGPGEGYDKPGTSGTPAPGAELKIVDEHDCELPRGQTGEVVVRPLEPWTAFTEYYGKPEATAAAFRNLWFHTGDRAYVDEDDHFHFVDRSKDAIRRRGENISAHEIEMILATHAKVVEVAAVPVPSELGEDEVAVYVVRSDEELSEQELLRHACENMAYYMVPRYVRFVEDLPKTPTHKIAKYEVRERAVVEHGSLWDRDAHGIVVTRSEIVFPVAGA